jgi:GNAT superfamily N-acetyltransferase
VCLAIFLVTRHGVRMVDYTIRPLNDNDHEWVKQFIMWHWGAEIIVLHGAMYRAETLSGFAAICNDEIAGLVTYQIQDDACEIITLDSLEVGIGIGTALIAAVKTRARQAGCKRLRLSTTDDNLTARHFYQKRGFARAVLHHNALEPSHQIKPELPRAGNDGIPRHEEIELEMLLDGGTR